MCCYILLLRIMMFSDFLIIFMDTDDGIIFNGCNMRATHIQNFCFFFFFILLDDDIQNHKKRSVTNKIGLNDAALKKYIYIKKATFHECISHSSTVNFNILMHISFVKSKTEREKNLDLCNNQFKILICYHETNKVFLFFLFYFLEISILKET